MPLLWLTDEKRLHITSQYVEQGSFPSAIVTKKSRNLSLKDIEREALHRDRLGGIAKQRLFSKHFTDTLESENGEHHADELLGN